MIGGMLDVRGADLSAAAGMREASEWALLELHELAASRDCRVDLKVSNPPYRSPFAYRATVTHERGGVVAAHDARPGELPLVIDRLLTGFRA